MRTLFLVLFLSVLFSAPTNAAEKALRVAIDEGYPPFSYIDPQTNQRTGFDYDMARALCKTMKRECEIVLLPFDSIIPEMQAGNIDIGIAGMGKTPEREAAVLFTDKYFRSSSLFIEIPGTVTISREGLKGKRIGGQKSSIQFQYLEKTYGDIATLVPYVGFDEIIEAVLKKEVDTALIEGLPGYYRLMTDSGLKLDIVGDPVRLDDVAFIAVRKGLEAERDALSAAIKTLRSTGEYDRINQKYFSFNVY